MSVRTLIEGSWRKANILTLALWPLSLVYRVLFSLRGALYQLKILQRYRAPLPVIIVGNLTVGGTGKTPLVIYLVEELRRQGFKPGVISRGYGSNADNYPCVVSPDTPVSHSGDEPALIVRRTAVPMTIGADRKAAIETLIKHADVDIIISDDGLQHLALQRDLEICLMDDTSAYSNKCLLPAGPYREPLVRLQSVDIIVKHGLKQDNSTEFAMNLEPRPPRLVKEQSAQTSVEFDPKHAFHAVAGIGNPQRFFDTCRALNYTFTAHSFADHHVFSKRDLAFDGMPVLMTEKDAVKCQEFADNTHWYLPVDAKLSEDFKALLMRKLQALKNNRTEH